MAEVGPTALPSTCCAPQLWLWPGQAVYVGPSLRLDAHSGSVACLAIAVDGTFTLRADDSSSPAVRSALIPPRFTHQVVAAADVMAFCYLDPGSVRHDACRHAMTATEGPIAYRHRREAALAQAASGLTDGETAHAWLDLAAPPGKGDAAGPTDLRMRDAITALTALPAPSAADLAALAGLSRSRFLHLFRDHTGTSFRRYRLWLRMLRAAELLPHRPDLTTAAIDAGFASSSHFSDAFHAMFGLRPRHLLGTEINLALPASRTA